MRPLLLILLLALFVPWGIDRASHAPDLPSSRSPSAAETTQPDNEPVEAPTPAQTAAREEAPAVVVPEPIVVASVPVPNTPQPDASVSSGIIAEIEAEVLRLTNIERTTNGLSDLSADTKLSDIAALHSEDMLVNQYFDHDDPNGCSSSCRATNAGYRWRAIGENIYMMSGYALDAKKMAALVVAGWMDSPGHRANILSDSFVESGVGVAIAGKDVYVTAVYGKER